MTTAERFSSTVAIPNGVNINANQSWTIVTGTCQGQFAAQPTQPAGFSAPTYNNNSVAVQNPQMGACGPQTTSENTPIAFAAANSNAISIPDPNAGGALLQVTLDPNGVLTLSQTSGLTFSTGTGSGDETMTFIGTIDDINAALDGLTYTPNTNYVGSDTLTIVTTDTPDSGGSYYNSDSIPITVVEGDTTTTFSSLSSTSTYGQSVTFTAIVGAVSPATGTPTGTVEFYDGGNPIGTGPLDPSGTATLSLATFSAGSHTITASYLTGGDFNPSSSATGVSLTINPYAFTYTINDDNQTYGAPANLAGDLAATIDTGVNGENLAISYTSAGDTHNGVAVAASQHVSVSDISDAKASRAVDWHMCL